MIAGRDDAGHDDGVDDTAGCVGARHLENDGERGRLDFFGVEAWVVVGDVEANEEDT